MTRDDPILGEVRRCRCCHNIWPIEFYTATGGRDASGVQYLRATCTACRVNCGPVRRRRNVQRIAAWRARLRADVLAVRAARAVQ